MNLQKIYAKLNLTEDCLVHLSDPTWKNKVSLPSRLMRLLESNDILKTLDAFFYFDNKPLILFFESCKNKKALHKAIWNLNESPIVIVIENNAVEIYNGYCLDKVSGLLEAIGGEDKLTDFSYFELVTGKTWDKYQKQLSHKNRVDFHLLENIEAAQKKLEEDGIEQIVANALLGKIIFIRYLIDRKVRLHFNNTPKYWSNEDLCELLKDKQKFWAFIQYLEDSEKGFNGDMFKITEEDYKKISEQSLNWLVCLLHGEDILTGQQSLFDLYDFSILPIEFISNVYEKFIGKENQNKNGAYYTPTFIVDYIVAETVGKKLNMSTNHNCKVLDPACGSGIFLVESLRRIIEKYISINNITNTDTNVFRNVLKNIVKTNIFGIDKDKSAIQVAVFSVYLTLLDYQEPADIENFKFPNLIGTNFICSDTFDVENGDLKAFEKEKHEFDFIIGNPPWKRGGIKKGSYCEKYLKQHKLLNKIGNKELAQAFVLRSMDFTTAHTQCALVLVSKILYNIDSKNFRSYILEHLFINQVFELAPVRKEVFAHSNTPAIAPACILFYQNSNGELTDNNIVTHIALKPSKFFSMFKVFSLTRNDIQQVQQNRLKQYPWLWKVLVYGSYLDFMFIKRLEKMKLVSDIISDENKFVYGTGIQYSSNPTYDSTQFIGKKFIDARAVNQFWIDDSQVTTFDKNKVHRIRNKKSIFIPPMLLCKKTLEIQTLNLRSCVLDYEVIFKNALASIRAFNTQDINILKNISCVFASHLYTYFAINTFSSIGIEREQSHFEDMFIVPYVDLNNSNYDILKQLYNQYFDRQQNKALSNNHLIKDQIKIALENLNDEIFDILQLNDCERDLIDYALKVSKPLITKSHGYENVFAPIKKTEHLLDDYAQVYIDRFASSFNRNGKRFVVEIYNTPQIIGMYFRVVDEKDFVDEIIYSKANGSLLAMAITLSSQRITDQLFVQKDIRGFDKEFFYIFKPNEKRLWHRAVAHLDVNEFDDAMLRVGRDN